MNGSSSPKAVVGLGASAGGLNAYTALLRALPADTGMAFVVVQHLAADHQSFLSALLMRVTQMPVIEVHDGPRVEPNTIYVIPPNRTLTMEDGHLGLKERAPGLHFAVDIFFEMLADTHGSRAIGVILSGSGSDGMKGVQAIKAAGGITFAQDGTAQHWSMPQSAVSTGCVDFVLAPDGIASELARLAAIPEVAFSSAPVEPRETLEAVLGALRQRFNIDFSEYKQSTLYRRIRRRMALRRMQSLADYRQALRDDPSEGEALCQDILINVTSFFRDPESFAALRNVAFPALVTNSDSEDPLRIWVVGCSSGEEAYSIAIALLEFMEERDIHRPVRIFGTDINQQMIARARQAWYPKSSVESLSRARRERYFAAVEGGYCVHKAVRALCTFAPHNAVTDPPFSKMDLVSCRNLLIYFQGALQRKLLPLLHFALKPHGFLFLGASESISSYRDLFDPEDQHHKIYRARHSIRHPTDVLSRSFVSAPASISAQKSLVPRAGAFDTQRIADLVALKTYVPPAVLVDDEGDILHFRGDVAPYLSQSDGRPSHSVFKVAREGLFAPLRSALNEAVERGASVRVKEAVVKNGEGLTTVSVHVVPVIFPAPRAPAYWVFFEPSAEALAQQVVVQARRLESEHDISRQIAVLTDELTATREHLEATIESQAITNEDLQTANEEVQSANEELQSTNEELETSKEEIESSNEELVTVNDELRLRNEELDRANDDLNNLLGSVQMAIVMVWQDLRIRRFTPLAQTLFNILPADVGRSIADMQYVVEIDQFPLILTQVIKEAREVEKQVRSRDGRYYLLRVRPYRTEDGMVDGAVVILIDIDALAQTQESLRRRVAELAAVDRHRNEFLAILAHELRNPLAPLRNAAHILNRAAADTAVVAKARDMIDRQVRHMSRLVSDLLDAARAENRQIRLQCASLDLRLAIEHVVETLRPVIEAKHQTLEMKLPAAPVWVGADSIRLEQIFTNLVNNANKFTPTRGTIEIRLEVADIAGASVAITQVIDSGVGLDPESIPGLFDLFTQADRSLAHAQGGLGIGLSLVRTLVELHGGQVSAHSEGCGRGSVFEVRLPVHDPALEVAAPAAKSDGEGRHLDGRSRRVLIVEDSADIRDSTHDVLALSGFEVSVAASGKEALESAPGFAPDAILLDVGLPDLTGYEVARRLRENPQFATTTLIAMTGYDTAQARAQSAAAGFDHHFCKPVDLDELVLLLAEPVAHLPEQPPRRGPSESSDVLP